MTNITIATPCHAENPNIIHICKTKHQGPVSTGEGIYFSDKDKTVMRPHTGKTTSWYWDLWICVNHWILNRTPYVWNTTGNITIRTPRLVILTPCGSMYIYRRWFKWCMVTNNRWPIPNSMIMGAPGIHPYGISKAVLKRCNWDVSNIFFRRQRVVPQRLYLSHKRHTRFSRRSIRWALWMYGVRIEGSLAIWDIRPKWNLTQILRNTICVYFTVK